MNTQRSYDLGAESAGDKRGWAVSRWRLVVGVAIAASLITTAATAQTQALPPPPTVPNPNGLPDLTPIPAPQGAQPFAVPLGGYPQGYPAAPQSVTAPNSYVPPATSYAVVVNGSSPYLLQQVQAVDYTASYQDYQGRRVIQAGIFGSEGEAAQRVAMLRQQGIGAQVVTVAGGYDTTQANSGVPGAFRSLSPSPHYEVVVPTTPENFGMVSNKMIGMGVKPEAIQAKRVPIGPHVSVGPFSQVGEAETISQYLRTGGMDARVYYAK